MSLFAYRIWLTLAYIGGVCAMVAQPLRAMLSSGYQGLLPYRGADESLYLVRLQEGLIDMTGDTTNGLWGGAHATTGMQMAIMERIAGWAFGWTGLDATWIAFFISALAAPSAILLAAALMRRAGSSRVQALILSIGFFIVMGMLRRYFNPSWSMPLTMLTILLLWRWWDTLKWRDILAAGVLLGIMPGVYFWSWTYTWAVFGLLFLFILDVRNRSDIRTRIMQYISGGIVSLIVGAPTLWMIYSASHSPLFAESSLRMGMIYDRAFESIPRSIVIACLAVGTWILWRKKEDRFAFAPLHAMAIASFVVMHQQFIHGRIMSFSSHYYWYVCLTALLVIAAIIARRAWRLSAVVAGVSAFVLLGGAWLDYYGRLDALGQPSERAMAFQHLAPVIASLKAGPKEVILSDRSTSNLLASTTNDDVVFTDYSRILLVSNQEYIERYCLSEALTPGVIDTDYIPTFNEEQSKAGKEMTKRIYDNFDAMTKAICPQVDANVPFYLKRYEVTTVLWNKQERPDWMLNSSVFTLKEEGEGWALYDVKK